MRTTCRVLAAAVVALLAGCTTSAAIQKGNARLLPESVTFDYLWISGVVVANGSRHGVSTLRVQCQSGVGSLSIQNENPIDNVLASGNQPEDGLSLIHI